MAFAKYVVIREAGSCACSEVQAASHLSLLALPTLLGRFHWSHCDEQCLGFLNACCFTMTTILIRTSCATLTMCRKTNECAPCRIMWRSQTSHLSARRRSRATKSAPTRTTGASSPQLPTPTTLTHSCLPSCLACMQCPTLMNMRRAWIDFKVSTSC